MTKSARPYLSHIRQALHQIACYCPPDHAAFITNEMAQDAILMRLQEIGENLAQLRRLNEETFIASAQDSWHKLIGLRNIISHGYHTIDHEQIWQIVTEELPAFAASLDEYPDQ